MYRLFSMGVIVMWISAMVALFMRDVWPAWTAQDPPPMTREQFVRLDQTQQQYGLFRSNEKRIGTAWNDIATTGGATKFDGTLLLDDVTFFRPIRVETATDFDLDGNLDSFHLDVYGVPLTTIKIEGERHGIYFPCRLQIGPLRRDANLDLSASRMIGESARPFSFLPTLKVGQSWRMQLVDPISAVMSGKTRFTPIVVRVTEKETIEHLGQAVECFVIETSPPRVKAWADAEGRVLVQQVEMPGLGKITVREERYNDVARTVARQRIPTWRNINHRLKLRPPPPSNKRSLSPDPRE